MATKKNITKGYNAVDTVFLRDTDAVETSGNGQTYITAYGEKDDVDITISPKGEGIINIGGVLFSSDSSVSMDRLEVDELIAQSTTVYTTSYSQGVSGTVFEVNQGETGLGVDGDVIAGLKVDRGLLDDEFVVFDEFDNYWKIGVEADLKRLPVIETWQESGVVVYDDDGNLESYAHFTADSTSVSISGQLYKGGSPVLNQAELGTNFVSKTTTESIGGNKTFTADVDVVGQLDAQGNTLVTDLYSSSQMYVQGSPVLTQANGANGFVDLTTTQSISGNKTFEDDTEFKGNIDADTILATGDIETQGTFKGDGTGITTITGSALVGAEIAGEVTVEQLNLGDNTTYVAYTSAGDLVFNDQNNTETTLAQLGATVGNFVPKTGGIFTGAVTISGAGLTADSITSTIGSIPTLTIATSLILGGQAVSSIVTDLSSASSTSLATSDAIKTYADNKTGKYAETIGDGSTNPITITHGLNTEDVVVSIKELSTNELVSANVQISGGNNVVCTFASAPTLNEFRVVVIG